jgi:hypothetical protein
MEVDLPSLKPNTAGGPRNDAVCFANEASEARLRALFRGRRVSVFLLGVLSY